MPDLDKTTIKVRAYPDDAKKIAPQSNLTEDQNNALELVKKNAQLDEAKRKLLELERAIQELRTNLAKEQARSADLSQKLGILEAEQKASQSSPAKVAELEAKVKELSEVLGKISGIAASGKPA